MFDDSRDNGPTPPTGYAPPVEAPDFELGPELPGWPKVVGISSIVWAGLLLTCSGCGILSMVMTPQFMKMAGAEAGPLPPTLTPGALQWVQMGLGILFVILLLIAGIATVQRAYQGRLLHLVYAIGSLPMLFWNIWTQLDAGQKMNQWAAANPDSPFAQGHSPGSVWIGITITLVLGLPWPLFCLVWFGVVKTKREDFTGGQIVDRV